MASNGKVEAPALSKASKRKAKGSEDSDSDSDVDFINVDFSFISPSEIDYQALKRLFTQLFYTHAPQLDVGGLADLVIKTSTENSLGTVIKVDDDEGQDPFAVISAVPLVKQEGAEANAAQAKLAKYLLARTPAGSQLHRILEESVSGTGSSSRATLVLHERMINMPPQVAGPLLRLLAEELEAANQTTKPKYLVFFSRVFSADALSDGEASAGEEDVADANSPDLKRRKKSKAKSKAASSNKVGPGSSAAEDLGLFHLEDELIAKHSLHSHTFRFPPPPDAADSFEAPLFGRIVVVPAHKLATVAKEVIEAFGES